MEDFVTFEIAKKLKDKGFVEKCLAYYDVEDNVGILFNTQYTDDTSPCQYTDLLQSHNIGAAIKQQDDSEYCIDCPTISQALKWLREEKEIFICIDCNINYNFAFFFNICKKSETAWATYGFDNKDYDTYEEAALAGIEYVLDNLI